MLSNEKSRWVWQYLLCTSVGCGAWSAHAVGGVGSRVFYQGSQKSKIKELSCEPDEHSRLPSRCCSPVSYRLLTYREGDYDLGLPTLTPNISVSDTIARVLRQLNHHSPETALILLCEMRELQMTFIGRKRRYLTSSIRSNATNDWAAIWSSTRIWFTTSPTSKFSSDQARCARSMRYIVAHMHTTGERK